MSGIYIHIPFCKSRCSYCDFYTDTNEQPMDIFVRTLCREARMRKKEANEPIETIYFGGGTPSRLHQKHFGEIFDMLFGEFSIAPDAEITLEANPDDLSPRYIQMLSKLPFNRISIGIQSFNDKELKFLNRRHSAQQAIEAVKDCQENGFDNISIDLMYGLPNQTIEIWKQNLQQTTHLNIQHISAYHLIYEENTRMYALFQGHKISPASDDLSTEMFSALIDMLLMQGFEHYEISNFAANKLYSRHNTSYWRNEKYIGLGPAAHSFNGEYRSWNVSSLNQYIQDIEHGNLEQETEHLSIYQKYNECILTGLRTMWGVNLQYLKHTFGEELHDFCMQNAHKFVAQKLLEIENHTLKLTRQGIFISDGIMSELMWV